MERAGGAGRRAAGGVRGTGAEAPPAAAAGANARGRGGQGGGLPHGRSLFTLVVPLLMAALPGPLPLPPAPSCPPSGGAASPLAMDT